MGIGENRKFLLLYFGFWFHELKGMSNFVKVLDYILKLTLSPSLSPSLSVPSSSGVFFSASEDESGTLGAIEEKIARATMLPRMHGEVL